MATRKAITLDGRAERRLYVLNRVLAGELTAAEAAAFLGLSVRSVRRLLARYRSPDGVASLIHGKAGRVPANRLEEALRERLVESATTTCVGVYRAHLAELLAERQGAATREEANAALADYLPRHNRRFAVPATDPASACPLLGPASKIPVSTAVRRPAVGA